MPLEKDTYQHVSNFAVYCRSAQQPLPVAVRSDRAPTYRRLVWNIVDDCLRRAYPICATILRAHEWEELVRDFMAGWDCSDPQLWKMPRQLCEFVRASSYSKKLGRPYLDDLLYFEWIEIEVFMMPDVPALSVKSEGDLFHNKLILNQEFRLIELSYPVFRVSANELEAHKGTYFLLAFRHPKTLTVRFMELSELWVEVVDLLAKQALSGVELLSTLTEELNEKEAVSMRTMLLAFLESLQQQGMLAGFR